MPQTWFRDGNLSHTLVLGLGMDMPVKFDSQSPVGVATITVPNAFPATAIKLTIEYVVLSGAAAATDNINVRFNGDTGNNYDYSRTVLGGAGYSSTGYSNANTIIQAGITPAATSPNNPVSSGTIEIWNPGVTGKRRAMQCRNTREDNVLAGTSYESTAGEWANTAVAITTVTIFLTTGPFVAPSTFNSYYTL